MTWGAVSLAAIWFAGTGSNQNPSQKAVETKESESDGAPGKAFREVNCQVTQRDHLAELRREDQRDAQYRWDMPSVTVTWEQWSEPAYPLWCHGAKTWKSRIWCPFFFYLHFVTEPVCATKHVVITCFCHCKVSMWWWLIWILTLLCFVYFIVADSGTTGSNKVHSCVYIIFSAWCFRATLFLVKLDLPFVYDRSTSLEKLLAKQACWVH